MKSYLPLLLKLNKNLIGGDGEINEE